MDDLVGAAEIAERIGDTKPRTVHQWHSRYPDFPEPVATISHAMIWSWPEVARWAKDTGRLGSRSR